MPALAQPAFVTGDSLSSSWELLCAALGRYEAMPEEDASLKERLKAMLKEAYATNPNALFALAVLEPGGFDGIMESFAAFQISPSNNSTAEVIMDLSGEGWTDAVQHVLTEWGTPEKLAAQDSGITVPAAIDNWDPSRADVASFLRTKTRQIIGNAYERGVNPVMITSVSMLKDGHAEAVWDKKRTRPGKNKKKSAPGEISQPKTSREKAIAAMPSKDPKEVEEEREDLSPKEYDVELDQIKDQPDWPLLAFVPNFDPENTNLAYVRAATCRLIGILAEFDADIAYDLPLLLDEVRKWDGASPVLSVVPEISPVIEKYKYQLAGISMAPRLDLTPGSIRAAYVEAEALTKGGPSPDKDPTRAQRALSELLCTYGETFPCDNAERPDHKLLCDTLGESYDHDLSGPKLHARMAELLGKLSTELKECGLGSYAEIIAGYNWDPASESLGDAFHKAAAGIFSPDNRTTSRLKSVSVTF